jgi:FkbM family methyltransferase
MLTDTHWLARDAYGFDDDRSFDSRDVRRAPVGRAPWWFRLARYVSKRKLRGGERLLRIARKRGWLDRLVLYPLGNGVELRVPLWRPCNAWDHADVLDYEASLVQVLGAAICQLPGKVTLIDCGADIGLVSAHLVARCRNIGTVVAFEPNSAAFQVLRQNLEAAAGCFRGRGRLISPPHDSSAHAMFVEPADHGDIEVRRVDDLVVDRTMCVIKIDVEGGEAAVIEGAQQTIHDARDLLLAFEANPRVVKRIGRDPVHIMRTLLDIRPGLRFEVDTIPTCSVTAERPLFEQLPPDKVYNVIARSPGC